MLYFLLKSQIRLVDGSLSSSCNIGKKYFQGSRNTNIFMSTKFKNLINFYKMVFKNFLWKNALNFSLKMQREYMNSEILLQTV